jgi:hypothetical protein
LTSSWCFLVGQNITFRYREWQVAKQRLPTEEFLRYFENNDRREREPQLLGEIKTLSLRMEDKF